MNPLLGPLGPLRILTRERWTSPVPSAP